MKTESIYLLVLLLILAFGAALRYIAVTETQVDTPIRADAKKYVFYAYNLKNFGIYSYSSLRGGQDHPEKLRPDALAPPGYPLFLYPFVNADGSLDYADVLMSQAVLSTLTIALTYFLFLALGRKQALLAAFLTACSPHLINMSAYLLTETLFCFFFIVFLVLAGRLARARLWLFGLAGFVLGLATLTRPWTQAFLFALLVFLYMTMNQKKFTGPLLLFAGFVAVIAPWLIRNYLALGILTDPTLSMNSIHHGMYPGMMYNFQPETLGFAYRFDPWAQSVSLTPQNLFDELSRRISEYPRVYFQWYFWGKLVTVFSWNIIAGMGDVFVYPVTQTPYTQSVLLKTTHALMWMIHPISVWLCLAGAALAWLPAARHMPPAFLFTFRLLSLLLCCFVLMHIIGAPYPRYSIPMRPVIYGMAVAVPVWAIHYFRYVSGHRSDSGV